jgi:hypothetical protein
MEIQIDMEQWNEMVKVEEQMKEVFDKAVADVDPNNPEEVVSSFLNALLNYEE